MDTEPIKTNSSTTSTQTVKPTLTNKSYLDYIDNKHYHVKKSFKDWEISKGVYRVWKNAFNQWKKYKDKGYHIYDNEGRQLD